MQNDNFFEVCIYVGISVCMYVRTCNMTITYPKQRSIIKEADEELGKTYLRYLLCSKRESANNNNVMACNADDEIYDSDLFTVRMKEVANQKKKKKRTSIYWPRVTVHQLKHAEAIIFMNRGAS